MEAMQFDPIFFPSLHIYARIGPVHKAQFMTPIGRSIHLSQAEIKSCNPTSNDTKSNRVRATYDKGIRRYKVKQRNTLPRTRVRSITGGGSNIFTPMAGAAGGGNMTYRIFWLIDSNQRSWAEEYGSPDVLYCA